MTRRTISGWLSCGWKTGCAVLLLCVVTALAAQAQTFTTLVSFSGPNGSSPSSSLIQGLDGNLYGTTPYGGIHAALCTVGLEGCGTIFRLTPAGVLTTLHVFCSGMDCVQGAEPGGLVLGTDGNLYGTTAVGGTGPCEFGSGVTGCGTIFKMTPAGRLTTLYSFCAQGQPCVDGQGPGGLVQGVDGNFYGTSGGGAYNAGTVFKITPTGTLTTLYSFCSQTGCPDGRTPDTNLTLALDGNLYGATLGGGYGEGTVFAITTGGTLTTRYSFCPSGRLCADGADPDSGLLQATDGSLYGMTAEGGIYERNDVCFFCGTVYKATLGGKFRVLYAFCAQPGCADGQEPEGNLIQGTDGSFYGTTSAGGDPTCNDSGDGCGTVFKITAAGAMTTLHTFCLQGAPCSDGTAPVAGMLQATNGTFYGTTSWSGPGKMGTIYALDMGLGPFVTFAHGVGKVGQIGGILGQGFTGTTAVSLNGVPATFTVVSDTYITATVPDGATTGYVTVTTPTGVLTSNVPFYVLK